MTDALHRQWLMLQYIPRAPRKVDVASLKRRLSDEGVDIGTRTLQRDLHKLSEIFPLVCDEIHKPYGWSWATGAEIVQLPGMDVHAALTFRLVQSHLEQALPRSTLRFLDKHFENARAVLKTASKHGLRSWPKRLRVISRTQPLMPPEVKPEVMTGIYDALLDERKLIAWYKGRADAAAKEIELNPLGLVLRDGAQYLVCTYWHYDDIRYLPLQRFTKVEVIEAARRSPPKFDLDAYVGEGGMAFRLGDKPLGLRARVQPDVAKTLEETPLSKDQRLEEDADGWWKLSATVSDTLVLRGWLLSYGPKLEVMGPKKLRGEIAKAVQGMAARYSS